MRQGISFFLVVFFLHLGAPARADGPPLELRIGTWFAGGTIGWTQTSYSKRSSKNQFTDFSDTNWTCSPTLGVFITNFLALTGSIQYSQDSSDSVYRLPSSSYRTSDSAEVRAMGFDLGFRYLFPIRGRLLLYVSGKIGLQRTDSSLVFEQWYLDDEGYPGHSIDRQVLSTYLLVATPGGGMLLALSPHVALDVGVHFVYQKGITKKEDEPHPLEFDGNILSFGYFGVMAFF